MRSFLTIEKLEPIKGPNYFSSAFFFLFFFLSSFEKELNIHYTIYQFHWSVGSDKRNVIEIQNSRAKNVIDSTFI